MDSPSKLPSLRRLGQQRAATTRPTTTTEVTSKSLSSSTSVRGGTSKVGAQPSGASRLALAPRAPSGEDANSPALKAESVGVRARAESQTSTATMSSANGAMSRMAMPGRTQSLQSEAQDERSMPPPTSIVRTQSLRKLPASKVPGATPSGTSTPSSGIQRTASRRIPGPSSGLSVATSTARSNATLARPQIHSRNNSVSSTPSSPYTVSASGLARSNSTAVGRPARSQSSATAASSGGSIPASPISESRPSARSTKPNPATTVPSFERAKPRPAFNTLQQHYSPAKSSVPKPPVPPARAAPAVDVRSAAPLGAAFDISKAQSELLYLSLMHEAAGPTLEQFKQSGLRKLGAKHAALAAEHDELAAQERACQQKVNTLAMMNWTRGGKSRDVATSSEFAENIQRLSSCVHEIGTLTEPGGRYAALVEAFSEWVQRAETASRHRQMESSTDTNIFINPLPREWHAAHTSISQRLRLLEREVELLPDLPSDVQYYSRSSLAQLLGQVRTLVRGMKEEVQVMAGVEEGMLEREREWVEQAIGEVSLDSLCALPVSGPAWRAE